MKDKKKVPRSKDRARSDKAFEIRKSQAKIRQLNSVIRMNQAKKKEEEKKRDQAISELVQSYPEKSPAKTKTVTTAGEKKVDPRKIA